MCSVCTISLYRPCSLHSLCNLCTGCIVHAVCIGYRPYSLYGLYGPYSVYHGVYHLCDPVLRPRMSAPWPAQSCDNHIDIFSLSPGHTNLCAMCTLNRLHRHHGLHVYRLYRPQRLHRLYRQYGPYRLHRLYGLYHTDCTVCTQTPHHHSSSEPYLQAYHDIVCNSQRSQFMQSLQQSMQQSRL